LQHVGDSHTLGAAYSGYEKVFSDLIVPLAEPGYRLACAMLHDAQAAQDVVQDASLKA